MLLKLEAEANSLKPRPKRPKAETKIFLGLSTSVHIDVLASSIRTS